VSYGVIPIAQGKPSYRDKVKRIDDNGLLDEYFDEIYNKYGINLDNYLKGQKEH
jgi:hypothetical protein